MKTKLIDLSTPITHTHKHLLNGHRQCTTHAHTFAKGYRQCNSHSQIFCQQGTTTHSHLFVNTAPLTQNNQRTTHIAIKATNTMHAHNNSIIPRGIIHPGQTTQSTHTSTIQLSSITSNLLRGTYVLSVPSSTCYKPTKLHTTSKQ